jgi:predicted molibdopterin-dependent oxidoreductase YjgC
MNSECQSAGAIMNASLQTVTFTINGREVQALRHETLIEVADREGIAIPRLCYMEGMEAVGNCRSCMVEIDGERVLAPSCCRNPSQGMKVTTDSERAVKAQKMVLELLASDMPEKDYTRHNEVDEWAAKLGVGKPRFPATRSEPAAGCHPRGNHRQPRRLHPVHALRARLPRRAGQRRDRPGLPRPGCEDRVRPGRPDGRTRPAWPAANACRPARPAP